MSPPSPSCSKRWLRSPLLSQEVIQHLEVSALGPRAQSPASVGWTDRGCGSGREHSPETQHLLQTERGQLGAGRSAREPCTRGAENSPSSRGACEAGSAWQSPGKILLSAERQTEHLSLQSTLQRFWVMSTVDHSIFVQCECSPIFFFCLFVFLSSPKTSM